MADKISRKTKIFIILIVFILPFFLIPLVAFILKLSLILGSVLPSWLIVMRINTNEIVSISTFIYYYTCFLAIEVTGILSYAIYQFSVNKENSDLDEKRRERKVQHLRNIIQINHELQKNYQVYIKERDNTRWSFYILLEVNHFKSQFTYSGAGQEFQLEKWKEIRGDLNIVFSEIKNMELLQKIECLYLCLDEIKNNTDKKDINVSLFKNFNELLIYVIEENEKIINYSSF